MTDKAVLFKKNLWLTISKRASDKPTLKYWSNFSPVKKLLSLEDFHFENTDGISSAFYYNYLVGLLFVMTR